MSQYTSSQAAPTSGVTASPSTSTIASNRCLWTMSYCAAMMPSEACLFAIRASRSSGSAMVSSTSDRRVRRDRPGQRALLIALCLVAAVEQIVSEFGMGGEHALVEERGDIADGATHCR